MEVLVLSNALLPSLLLVAVILLHSCLLIWFSSIEARH